MSDKNCLFCKLIQREIPTEVVYEDDKCFVFKDINPQAPVHLLIIPKQHIPTLNDLESVDPALIGHLFQIAGKLAKEKGLAEDGYRVNVNCGKNGGQEVFHLHLHLLGGRSFTWPPG